MTTLYLETSVIGAYLDKGDSFRRDLTIRWWDHELPIIRFSFLRWLSANWNAPANRIAAATLP